MQKISIPKPCFESWENMTPDGMGRFCGSCNKTVVDFTSWDDESVKNYFIQHYGGKVCGRFKKEQLDRITITLPQNIFHLKLSGWKKFLAILLLCFGSSFLNIDTGFANTTTFFQGEPISMRQSIKTPERKSKKHWKKSHRKKRRKSTNTSLIDFDFKDIVLGYMPTTKLDPPIHDCFREDLTDSFANKQSINYSSTVFTENNNNLPEKKHPKRQNNPLEAAFISSQLLISNRRSLFKKK